MSRFRHLRRDSRYSVHTQFLYKDKHRIERQQGRTYQVLFTPSRGALPPVRRTGLHTQDASGLRPESLKPHSLHATWKFVLFKKEYHHV